MCAEMFYVDNVVDLWICGDWCECSHGSLLTSFLWLIIRETYFSCMFSRGYVCTCDIQ